MAGDEQFTILMQLEGKVGREAIIKLLTIHRKNVEDTIAALSQITSDIDYDHIHMTAHRLKGACGSLGFAMHTELFGQMDVAAAAKNGTSICDLIKKVQEQDAQLKLAISDRYPELKA